MIRSWPLAVLALAAGCSPPGEHTKDLAGGYRLIKHDGLRQIVGADGNITVNHVEEAEVEGGLIRATVENGAIIEVEPGTGEVRTIAGERQ